MIEETSRTMTPIYLEVAIRFCFQADLREKQLSAHYLDVSGKAAYEQLICSCLNDPHTRRRLLLFLATLEMEEFHDNSPGTLYNLISGETATASGAGTVEQEILQPHLVPGAPYSYWANEAGEPDDLDITPLRSILTCHIADVSLREVNPTNDK